MTWRARVSCSAASSGWRNGGRGTARRRMGPADRRRYRTAAEESGGRTARSRARPARARRPSRYSGITRPRISSSTSRSSSLSASLKPRCLCTRRRTRGVVVEVERIDPGELVPHLQIEKVLRRVSPARVALLQQLGIARIPIDHPPARRVKKLRQHGRALVLGQRVGRLQAELEVPVARAVLRRTLRAGRAATAPG